MSQEQGKTRKNINKKTRKLAMKKSIINFTKKERVREKL